MPKTVYVLHPMRGNIRDNTRIVVTICRKIHSPEIIPVFPSFTTRRYLTADPKDRELAAIHILEYFKRGFIDEVWVYGNHISDGMWREMRTAHKYNVPVVAKTSMIKKALRSSKRRI